MRIYVYTCVCTPTQIHASVDGKRYKVRDRARVKGGKRCSRLVRGWTVLVVTSSVHIVAYEEDGSVACAFPLRAPIG